MLYPKLKVREFLSMNGTEALETQINDFLSNVLPNEGDDPNGGVMLNFDYSAGVEHSACLASYKIFIDDGVEEVEGLEAKTDEE